MIHKFIFDSIRLVYDVHSGALHVVDQMAWDLLEDYGNLPADQLLKKYSGQYRLEDLAETLGEINELVEKQLLFSPDPLGGSYNPPEENIVKALCMHLAHDCNLRCRYCFAGQGKFGGTAGLMSAQVGKKALEFLMEAAGTRRHVEVDFFGGEPLLNFEVMKILVDYGKDLARARGKEIKFTVTTNAVLLDRRIGDFLNRHQMSVVLSLDGRPGVHDAMRPFPGGQGSYEIVLKNIQDFLESRDYQDYYIRGTYTAVNPDFAKDVDYLRSLGFENISLEPVVSDAGEYYSLKSEMLEPVASQYDELTRQILAMKREGKHINFFHFNIDIDGGPCLPKRMSGCGAGHQYLAVDPEGGLYPCHQFVGQEDFSMGDVFSGVHRQDLVNRFKNMHIYHKEGCSDCWAKFLCSGGCHASAHLYSGSLAKPYSPGCVLAKKRLECALYLSLWKHELL